MPGRGTMLTVIPEAKTSSSDGRDDASEESSDEEYQGPKPCPGYQTCFVTTDLTTMTWLTALTTHLLRASPESSLREISDVLIVLSGVRRALYYAKGTARIFTYPEYPYPHPTRKSLAAMERSPDLKTALFYWYRHLVKRLSSVILFRAGVPGAEPVCTADIQVDERSFFKDAYHHTRLILWLHDHESFPERLSIEPWLVLLAVCTQLAALRSEAGTKLTSEGWLRGLHQCCLILEQVKDGPCVSATLRRSLHAYYCYRVGQVYEAESLFVNAAMAYRRAAEATPLTYKTFTDAFCAKHGYDTFDLNQPINDSWRTRFCYAKKIPHLPHDRALLHLTLTPFEESWLPDLIFCRADS